MSFATSLEDGPISSLPGGSLGGTIGGGGAFATASPPLAQRTETVPPMPTDTFTPLPGQRPRRCCGGASRGTVVNVNVNAGNNNGNDNGNNNGSNHGGPTSGAPASRGGTYVDTPSGFDTPTRIQRVEVPVEKIIEKPIYKPMVVVREIIRKIKEYVPMKQVYERRVGKPYDDQPISFEGSATRATTKSTTTTSAPATPTNVGTRNTSSPSGAVAAAGTLPGDQPEYDNATLSMTLPKP